MRDYCELCGLAGECIVTTDTLQIVCETCYAGYEPVTKQEMKHE